MCVLSVVMEQYQPYIPNPNQWSWPQPPAAPAGLSPDEIAEMRELLDSFRKMVEGAKAFDRLTGQPDCVDPEKAKLEERVAELERRLDAIAGAAAA